ncbi:hypothetical protein CR513_35904, partial [Mucuna pruriens]
MRDTLGRKWKKRKIRNLLLENVSLHQFLALKRFKVGKPFKYQAYDKESDSYVVEEIKIPEGNRFHASREDGRLKLFANFLHEEESQENYKRDINGAKGEKLNKLEET